MIKRSWAVFFLLIANIILLGHAVIPHHHNNSLPSLIALHGHQSDISEPVPDNHPTDNHGHQSENDFRNCLLNQYFVNQSNSHRIDVKYLDNYNPHTDLYGTLPGQYNLESVVAALLPSFSTHFLRSNYTNYINLFCGLRAPPVV